MDEMRKPPIGAHDVGGAGAGPAPGGEHPLTLHEKRVDALFMLLAASGNPLTVDAHRRAIEELSDATYENTAYYDRWLLALRRNLEALGILDAGEIEAKLAAYREEADP